MIELYHRPIIETKNRNKLVFSIDKCIQCMLRYHMYNRDTSETLYLIHKNWLDLCQGKTKEEIEALGLKTRPEFMEEQ